MKEQYPEEKDVGRPRLQYLKQVARNTEADSYTANEENGLQQFQMESCQLIKRPKNKKKKINFNYFLIAFIRFYRWNFNANLKLPVTLQLLESPSTM